MSGDEGAAYDFMAGTVAVRCSVCGANFRLDPEKVRTIPLHNTGLTQIPCPGSYQPIHTRGTRGSQA